MSHIRKITVILLTTICAFTFFCSDSYAKEKKGSNKGKNAQKIEKPIQPAVQDEDTAQEEQEAEQDNKGQKNKKGKKGQKASGAGEKKQLACKKCLGLGDQILLDTYLAVEEEDWNSGIKTCEEGINAINDLSQRCGACPEPQEYIKVIGAFRKYAEGGIHLDGAEEPKCSFAIQLFTDTINDLESSLQTISSQQAKFKIKNIRDYAKEEKQFVSDECQKN